MTGETTSEGREETVTWVEDKGVEYGNAYDDGLAMFHSLGLEFFPSAVLVDPFGQVVYAGSPARLTNEVIESALGEALPQPMHAWGADLDPVKTALSKGHYGPALAALETLPAGDLTAQLPDFIAKRVAGRMTQIAAMVEAGDIRGARAALENHTEAFAGLDAELARLVELDKAAQTERSQELFDAQASVAELLSALKSEEVSLEEALGKFEAIAEKFPGKQPGDEAAKWVAGLKDFLEQADGE